MFVCARFPPPAPILTRRHCSFFYLERPCKRTLCLLFFLHGRGPSVLNFGPPAFFRQHAASFSLSSLFLPFFCFSIFPLFQDCPPTHPKRAAGWAPPSVSCFLFPSGPALAFVWPRRQPEARYVPPLSNFLLGLMRFFLFCVPRGFVRGFLGTLRRDQLLKKFVSFEPPMHLPRFFFCAFDFSQFAAFSRQGWSVVVFRRWLPSGYYVLGGV